MSNAEARIRHKDTSRMTFAELMRSEEELLQRLLIVSQRSLESVDMGCPTLLLEHLEQWEQLGNEIELLEQQLAPYKGIPWERQIWKNVEECQLTVAALDQSKALLEEITANSQVIITKVNERKRTLELALRKVTRK